MTMRITMRSARRSEDGLSVYDVGSTQTVSNAFGTQMVQLGCAIDTDGVLPVTPVSPLLATAAQAAAFPGLVSGDGMSPAMIPRITEYTTSGGSGTYYPPKGAKYLEIEMVAAGGGGAGSGTAAGSGGAGGNTEFGPIKVYGGSGGTPPGGYGTGGGAGGAAMVADVAIPGAPGGNSIPGTTYSPGTLGGSTPLGRNRATPASTSTTDAPPANTGCGGNGAGTGSTAPVGGGGGGGGYVSAFFPVVSDSYTWAVGAAGAAGAAGTSGFAGAAGSAGFIRVRAYVPALSLEPGIGLYPYRTSGASPSLAGFATWLGRAPDEALAFIYETSWAEMRASAARYVSGPNAAFWASTKPAWTLALTISGTSLATVAGGANDADFTYIAQQMALAQPTGEIRVRLGWEQNGTWYPWKATGFETDYINAFRRVAGLLKAVSSRVAIEWAPVYTVSGVNTEASYPGSDVVDVIGLSCYYDVAVDSATAWYAFLEKRDSTYGLAWQVAFAKARQKRLTMSEWGVNGDGKEVFVQAMSQWIKAQRYEHHNYWDSRSNFVGILSDGTYPTTGARFKYEFGPKS